LRSGIFYNMAQIDYSTFKAKLADLIANTRFDEIFALFDAHHLTPEEFENDIIAKKAELKLILDGKNYSELTGEEARAAQIKFFRTLLPLIQSYKDKFPLRPKTDPSEEKKPDYSIKVYKALLKLNYDREHRQLGQALVQNKKQIALVFNRFNSDHYLGFLKLVSVFKNRSLDRRNFKTYTRTAYEFDKPVDDQKINEMVNTWLYDRSVLIIWNLRQVPSQAAEANLTKFWLKISDACRQKNSDNYLVFIALAESIEGVCPACFKEQPQPAELDAGAFIYSVLPEKFLKNEHINPWLNKISDDFVGLFDLPDADYFDNFDGNPGQIVFEFCEYVAQKLNYKDQLYDQLIEQNYQNWKRDE
jgi:hypothetical protein